MNRPIRTYGIPGMALLVQSLLAASFLAGAPLRGEDRVEPPKAPGGKVAEPDAKAAWQRRIPELVADNVSLEQIVQELRHQFPEINFLVRIPAEADTDPGAIPIKMMLRAVTLPEILEAIELAATSPLQIVGAPIERLVVFEKKRAETGLPPVGIETRVFNLKNYLESRTEEQAAVALKQLEEVVHMTGGMLIKMSSEQRRFNPQLSFHPSTKLLIVVGRPDELQVVEQVVKELQGPSPANKVTAAPERESGTEVRDGLPAARRP